MTDPHDRLIVVDIEATCWENNRTPKGMRNEIIEVGVCVLTISTRTLSNKSSILVKPVRSVVSPFCTQLTTLTQDQVDGGVDIQTACQQLVDDYDSPNVMWASWGDYDRQMFVEQCQSMSVTYPFSERHINLKQLHSNLYHGRRRGMRGALAMAGLDLIGTHHRGDDDAWNIGRLTIHMLDRFGAGILHTYLLQSRGR